MPGAQFVVVSAGHDLLLPLQLAGLTRTVALWQLAALHEVPEEAGRSSGQAVPEQVSATSHSPVACRHTVPAGGLAAQMSPGHVDWLGGHVVPLHTSAGSQLGSLLGRHTVPAGMAGCEQLAEPLQTS